MFSSPSKQATAAAQQSQQISQQDIQQLEGYVEGQQKNLQGAIGAQGPNPYFGAAQQLNPQAYYTDPKNTVTFGNQGPGTTMGKPSAMPTQSGPPGLPPVILNPQTIPGQAPIQPTPSQPPPGQQQPIQGGGGDGPINPITGLPIRGGVMQRELM